MFYVPEDIPNDVLEEMHAERKRLARLNHWCSVCHGHTGPGSPCFEPPPEAEEDDSPYCECNAEPTVSELEDGKCDACGKAVE